VGLRLVGEVGLDGSGFENGLKRIENKAGEFASDLERGVGRRIVEVFSAAAVYEFTKSIIESAEQLNNAAVRFRTTSEQVQNFSFAAKQAGEDLEVMEHAMDKIAEAFNKTGNEGENSISALRRLGVSAATLRSQNASEALKEMGEAMGTMSINSQVTSDVMEVFGAKMGTRLIPVLKEYVENAEKLKALGGPISNTDLKILQDSGKALGALGEVAKKTGSDLLSHLLIPLHGVVTMAASAKDILESLVRMRAPWKEDYDPELFERLKQRVMGRQSGFEVSVGSRMRFDTRDTGGTPMELFGSNRRLEAPRPGYMLDPKEEAELQRIAGQAIDERKKREFELLDYQQKRLYILKEIGKEEIAAGYRDPKVATEAQLRLEQLKTALQTLDLQERKKSHFKPHSDALVRVGNFLGSSRSALEDIGKQHTRLLTQIAHNTKLRTAKKFLGDFNLPGEGLSGLA
jgi:hypothetical protein